MQLKRWRLDAKKTLNDCAVLFGLANARSYQRYETGENRAEADLVERFVRLTGGAVTPLDMHETRLEWLKDNQPERFAEAAE